MSNTITILSLIGFIGLIGAICLYKMTEEFWTVHYWKRGQVQAKIRIPGINDVVTEWCKIEQAEDKSNVIHYNGGTYLLLKGFKHEVGRFKIPTYYFTEGNPNPALLGSEVEETATSARQIEAMRKWHTISDIMNSLHEDALSQSMMIAIVAGLVLLGSVGSYFAINHSVSKKITEAVAPLYPTPTPTGIPLNGIGRPLQ